MVAREKYVLMIMQMYLVVNNKLKVPWREISKSRLLDTLEFIFHEKSRLSNKIPPLAKIEIGPPIQYSTAAANKNEGPT